MAIKSPFPPLPTGSGGDEHEYGREHEWERARDSEEGAPTVEIPVYRVEELDTAPLDITKMDTAVLVKPEEAASIYHWFAVWTIEHEEQADACDRAARRLGPQLWSVEGALNSLYEHEERLAGYSRPSLRDVAQLKRTRAQITECERERTRLHDDLVTLRSAAREHRAAAAQLRAQVQREAQTRARAREMEHTWSQGFARGMGGLG